MFLLVCLPLALVDPPTDGPTLRLPPEVRAPIGRIVILKADSTGSQVRWALTADEADLVPFPDGKTALFCSPRPGRFLILAWTASGDVPSEAARCVVIVGEPTPPEDPLRAECRTLFTDDPGPSKRVQVRELAGLYREAATLAGRPELRTAGDLFTHLKAQVSTLLPMDALVPLRQRLAAEIARTLTADPAVVLDPALRTRASDLFTRIAIILEGLS